MSLKRTTVVLSFLVCVATGAQAQSVSAGEVSGVVQDAQGHGVADALVTLSNQLTGDVRYTETLSDGAFVFSLVPAGIYDLVAEQLGFRPVRMVAVAVQPGASAAVSVALVGVDPPVTTIDTVGSAGMPPGAVPGVGTAWGRFAIARLPWEGQELPEMASLSSHSLDGFRVEGLDERQSWYAVEGIPFVPVRHAVLPSVARDGAAFPLMAFDLVALVASPVDVEWSGLAGTTFHSMPRRGSRSFAGRLYADWTGSVGAGSDQFAPNDVSHSSFRGGALVSGPIIPDTAHFVVGAEAHRLQVPMAPAWIATADDASLTAVAANSYGVDVQPYLQTRVAERQWISAFGHFDWRFSRNQRAAVWSSFASFKDEEPAVGAAGIVGVGTQAEGTDVTAGATVTSEIGLAVANELRFGFMLSNKESGRGALPATRIGGRAVAFGVDPAQEGLFERSQFTLTDALQLRLGTVKVKLGGAGSFTSYEQTFTFAPQGMFWFSDVSNFEQGRGLYVGPGAATAGATARFSVLQVSGFLQNTWTVIPGLDVRFGLRYDGEWSPVAELARNADWFALTGIASDTLDGSRRRFENKLSPRFGFRWALGASSGWIVQGSAGVYQSSVDPVAWGEAIRESGGFSIYRGVGPLGGWPNAPDPSVAPQVGRRLTILGSDLDAPRSSKLSFGLSRRIGRSGMLEVSGHYRHTDFLTRRHDLNLSLSPSGEDQYGRSIYGSLLQEGNLLAPDPGSNRRFDGFELVSALDPDGYSDYWGITGRLHQPLGRFLRLDVSYTYSQTTDNILWGGYGGPYAELTPFPDSLNGVDWADGRSDFDVPHRVSVGAELRPLGRDILSVAVLYRYRSGLPFTPGFQNGVDANGDGSWSNDPAYVDATLPGTAEVVAQWDCLRPFQSRIAGKNACRDPSRSTLDLRVGLGPVRLGGAPIELYLDLLNVTDADGAVRDHALLLVDPSGTVVRNPTTGDVTIPFLVNNNFGEPMAYRAAGRRARIGLKVNY
ncbi:MAG: TonB-dependent receptor [Gemmatimonadota bacterium]|nr:TonB-dependent receptor [Gemmatimonadota bacterium]